MSKKSADLNQLDAYLARIEAREQKSRRRRFVAGILIVGALGGGALALRYLDQPADMAAYALADLNVVKINNLLADNPQGILVHDPEFGSDTVRNATEYEEIMSLLSMIRDARNQSPTSVEADTLNSEVVGTLPMYPVDIEGQRISGSKLVFTIENFDPSISYILDFGNGYRQRIRRQAIYTYPSAGVFRLKLLAFSQDQGNSVYEKELSIEGGTTSQEVIAQQEAAPQEQAVEEVPVADTATQLAAVSRTLRPMSSINRPEAPLTSAEAASDLSQPVLDSRRVQPQATAERSLQPTERREENSLNALLMADLMPEFPGGSKGMARYIRKSFRYPQEATEQRVEGSVYIRFIVQPDDSITEPTIVQGIGHGCDEEALRIVNSMPRWIPGEHGGSKVPVYKTIAIGYRLAN